MNQNKIALFGLGKLGLPLSVVLAQSTKMIGIDKDEEKIKKLNHFQSPFYEPKLDDYLVSVKDSIEFSTLKDYNIDDFDVAIILVNTPSTRNGDFSNAYVFGAIYDICDKLNQTNKKDFLFIVSSTVMPGSHNEFIREISRSTKRKLNDGFGYVYIPDLVALGNVIDDFQNPDVLIMGESDSRYGDIAESIYRPMIKNNAPIHRMGLYEAEITKISLNAYITMKISFANFIGNICDKLDCDPTKITNALGCDKRISPYYIKSGLPFGGTCFPRDTWAFIKLADDLGLDATHIKATQEINEKQHQLLYEKVAKYKSKRIGIWGVSFKPHTGEMTESAGARLHQRLFQENFNVVTYDPIIETTYKDDGYIDFVKNCDVIVLTHNDKKIPMEIFENKIVINPWNL